MSEVLAVAGLCKRYGAHQALRDVTFAVHGPTVVGVLGPNGAGKTTLLEILEGVRRPTSGEVRLFGAPLGTGSYPKRRVGAVFQSEPSLEGLRVIDYARLYAAIYDMPGGERDIVARAGLVSRERVLVTSLSEGQAQRLFLAAALVHRPALVFLDEPTARLDPASKAEIGHFIRELAQHATVVMATHDLREAETVCDTLVFLVRGELRAHGTREELLQALPAAARMTGGLEDAFFHYAGARIDASGDIGDAA